MTSISISISGKNTGVGHRFPPPGDLPDPGTEPASPAFQEDFYLLSQRGSLRTK